MTSLRSEVDEHPKIHHGHRIVVHPDGAMWNAIVYAPSGAIMSVDLEGETARDAKARAMKFVDARLAEAPATAKT
jgi:hypothetical protein